MKKQDASLIAGTALHRKKRKSSRRDEELEGGSCAALGPDVHDQKAAEGLICDYETGKWAPKEGG